MPIKSAIRLITTWICTVMKLQSCNKRDANQKDNQQDSEVEALPFNIACQGIPPQLTVVQIWQKVISGNTAIQNL